MTSISIFGGSITWGAWDHEKLGWINRLRKEIEKKEGIKYLVYNRGVSGDTSEWLSKRIDIELEAIGPKVVIFAIGINDSLFYINNKKKHLVAKEDFKGNLDKLFSVTKKYTDKILFVGLTNVEESKLMPWNGKTGKECYSNQEIKKYDGALEEFCKKHSITFIPMQNVLDIKEDLFDGLHPNAKGHEKIFKKVLPVVEKIIKKL